MSESRKSHHSADGGQAKEDDHVVSYKQIPQVDSELRTSKPSLSKSKEKITDEAEEKLLEKEREAKITTRVDMADAKYVVGDHRNGDAKIELDANKRQFSGLTKEELLKYAEDPFWVRLRWAMFVLFWALWLCMLGGAIAIIVRAPKCAAPQPRTWYEEGPLVDLSPSTDSAITDLTQLEDDLPTLERASVRGVFVKPCEDSYESLEQKEPGTGCLAKFKAFAAEAKKRSIRVIVDLTANFVSTSHAWFKLSENRTGDYASYFVWAAGTDYDGERPKVPNNWVSVYDDSAWSWSASRGEYYLRQYAEGTADLNMSNPAVVARFEKVLEKFMAAGASGIRLLKARQLVVDPALPDEPLSPESGAPLNSYGALRHRHTADRPELDDILAHWAHQVALNATEPTVFTLAEDGRLPVEWHRLRRNATALRPPSLAPVAVRDGNMTALADSLNKKLNGWPALQLVSPDGEVDVATLSLLLPAAPVLTREQIFTSDVNDTVSYVSSLAALREDASVQHGQLALSAVPAADNSTGSALIACARWKAGHTGYVSVVNAGGVPSRGDLSRAALPALPAEVAVHYLTNVVALHTNYTINSAVQSAAVLIPARSAVLFSFVPNTATEE